MYNFKLLKKISNNKIVVLLIELQEVYHIHLSIGFQIIDNFFLGILKTLILCVCFLLYDFYNAYFVE